MKPGFCVVGCGRVGTTLVRLLTEKGYECVGVSSRSESSAKNAAEICGCPYTTDPWDVTRKAELVFLSTPDGVIEAVCDRIAEKNGFKENASVLHLSGAHPSSILGSAKKNGAMIGSMHPLQSFAKEGEGNPFDSIVVSLEGEKTPVETARTLATELGANCVDIQTGAKTLYHASAVVASNYLVALLSFSFDTLIASGVKEEEVFSVLGPLIKGTLANIEKSGISMALTGPIARGDAETVSRHLHAFSEKMPEYLPLYRELGKRTLQIAEENLSKAAAEAIRKELDSF